MANLNTNRSYINGDVDLTEDNDTTIATGHGTAFGAGAHDNVAATGPGSIAAGGDLAQADHGAFVAQHSSVGGPVATNPVNSITSAGSVDHSIAGQDNIGVDGSGGGLHNAALNFGSGTAVGGGNIDASHKNLTSVDHSEDVNLAQDGSSATAHQDDNTELFKDSFNTDDHTFNQDNSVHQARDDHHVIEDNDFTEVNDY